MFALKLHRAPLASKLWAQLEGSATFHERLLPGSEAWQSIQRCHLLALQTHSKTRCKSKRKDPRGNPKELTGKASGTGCISTLVTIPRGYVFWEGPKKMRLSFWCPFKPQTKTAVPTKTKSHERWRDLRRRRASGFSGTSSRSSCQARKPRGGMDRWAMREGVTPSA